MSPIIIFITFNGQQNCMHIKYIGYSKRLKHAFIFHLLEIHWQCKLQKSSKKGDNKFKKLIVNLIIKE